MAFILTLLTATQLSAQPQESISLLSRLDFAPSLLEMIRKDLEKKLDCPCSLVFQPVDSLTNVKQAELSTLLLVEAGIDPAALPSGSVKSEVEIELVWVLAVNSKVLELIKDQPLTLEKFARILIDLKKSNPERFPWFEPLVSKNTLRNFCLVLGEMTPKNDAKNESGKEAFSQQHNAIAILYRAIETELLNPLSVEADLGLAMDVFAAGDAMFVSHWVTADCLVDHKNCLPFPDQTGSGKMPRMRLQLWRQQGKALPANIKVSSDIATLSPQFIDLDFARETDWIEKNYAKNYDSLIMGDL